MSSPSESIRFGKRDWREIREHCAEGRQDAFWQPSSEDDATSDEASTGPPVLHRWKAPTPAWSTSERAAQAILTKKPYPNVIPSPDPPLAWLFPDPKDDYAPLHAAGVWGGIGTGLGVLRGLSLAMLSEPGPGFTRGRAFAMGFCFSTPWYVSFFALAAVGDVYAARWADQRPRLLDTASAVGALGAGELG